MLNYLDYSTITGYIDQKSSICPTNLLHVSTRLHWYHNIYFTALVHNAISQCKQFKTVVVTFYSFQFCIFKCSVAVHETAFQPPGRWVFWPANGYCLLVKMIFFGVFPCFPFTYGKKGKAQKIKKNTNKLGVLCIWISFRVLRTPESWLCFNVLLCSK